MAVEKERILNDIAESFSEIERIVKARQYLEHTSILHGLEIFFRDLLNLCRGWSLEDTNFKLQGNAPGIDLHDNLRKIAVQVTVDSSAEKVKKTLKGIGKHWAGHFERIIIVYPQIDVTPTKAALSDLTLNAPFDPKTDQWGLGTLLKELKYEATSVSMLIKVRDFLRTEVPKYSSSGSTMVGPQVETMIEVIDAMIYLAEAEGLNHEELAPEQDAKFARFVDHASWLKEQWKDHRECYLTVDSAKKSCGLDVLRGRRMASFLKNRSREVLAECEDDPQGAFNELTKRLLASTSSSLEEPDEMAVRYFLADQLVACNVFPNPETLQTPPAS